MKFTVAEVKDTVDSEGMGHAIQFEIAPKNILDPVLQEMWEEAKELLERIEAYLEDHAVEEEDDEEDGDDE